VISNKNPPREYYVYSLTKTEENKQQPGKKTTANVNKCNYVDFFNQSNDISRAIYSD